MEQLMETYLIYILRAVRDGIHGINGAIITDISDYLEGVCEVSEHDIERITRIATELMIIYADEVDDILGRKGGRK